MNRALQPASLAAPAANYSLAVLSEGPAAVLHTSGIVPTRPDGTVPVGLAEQADVIWGAISTLLAEAGMAVTDLVSITTYVVVGNDLAVVMAARDRWMAGHRPSSTLVTVPALARPEWQIEIAAVAAK